MLDLVIANGTIVTSEATFRADVGVVGAQIVAIGANLMGARTIDARGKYVIPGGVDIHVHMQMPAGDGVVSSDTFHSGTRAAALGGTTAIVDFVEPEPEESLLAALAARRAAADPQVVIDYGLHMTLGPAGMAKLDQIPGAYEAGCGSFKVYTAYDFRLHDGQLMQVFEAIKGAGGLPVIHAENWDVITTLVARNVASGRMTPHWHPRSRPALLEGEAVGRVIDLAEYVGVHLHVFHVSCAAAADRIRSARRRGLPITGETCPQYLFLTQDAYDAPGVDGCLPVCSPPLRPLADQEALWQTLARGDLQIVTTDHCPFTRTDKARGLDDFSRIPGGVPSIEMRLVGVYQGVVRGLFSLNRWVELCCTGPARLAGLAAKGDIAIGHDADLVIFDPLRRMTLSKAVLHERVDWTPYEGLEVQGWAEVVLSRGEVIAEGGECHAAPGRGRFLSRKPQLST